MLGWHVALGQVAGIKGEDECAMMEGKIVDHALSLHSLGTTPICTVPFFMRLRGGSCENVPRHWTCTKCFAERCWPVRSKWYGCGERRNNSLAPWNGRNKGKECLGPIGSCSSGRTQLCAAHGERQKTTCCAYTQRSAWGWSWALSFYHPS